MSIVQLLSEFQQIDEQVINSLINALKDDQPSVRESAASALENLGSTDAQVINALINALKDDVNGVNTEAATAIIKLFFLRRTSLKRLRKFLIKGNWSQKILYTINKFLYITFTKMYLEIDFFLINRPAEWLKTKFYNAKVRFFYLSESRIIPHTIEAITGDKWQEVFDSSNAVLMIIKEFMDESSPDSIYYTLPFFSIRKLRLQIAMELIQELDNPDIPEYIKRIMFNLLMRVKLLDEEGKLIERTS